MQVAQAGADPGKLRKRGREVGQAREGSQYSVH